MPRHLVLGLIKIHILHHAALEAVYGVWLIEELARHGYSLSPGTLYPTLHSLEQEGYLHSEKRVVAGRQRRYYMITPQGAEALAEARIQLRELVNEVLSD